jgi:hypothetical protein
MRNSIKSALAVAAGAGILSLASPADASLLIDFKIVDGASEVKSVQVPLTGATYTVKIYASYNGGTPGITNFGLKAGYVGALSSDGPSNTVGGGAGTGTALAAWGGDTGTAQELNADGHIDMGESNGTAKTDLDWLRPNSGASAVLVGNATTPQLFATFQVTIPAYTDKLSEFMDHPAGGELIVAYLTQIDPFGAGTDWSWEEWVNATKYSRAGSVGSASPSAVNAGAMIEFLSAPIPEPATLGVLAVGGLALMRRRRHH